MTRRATGSRPKRSSARSAQILVDTTRTVTHDRRRHPPRPRDARPRDARDQGRHPPDGRPTSRRRSGPPIAALVAHDADGRDGGDRRRRADQRDAARGLGADHADDRDPVAGRPRPAVPAGPRPRRLRARADGRPRRLGRQAGPQARAGAAAQEIRRPAGDGRARGDPGRRRSCGRSSTSMSTRPERSRPATTRSTSSTTGPSTRSSS